MQERKNEGVLSQNVARISTSACWTTYFNTCREAAVQSRQEGGTVFTATSGIG